VNVAARLEGQSDPGGLCISRMVRDEIRDKLAYSFEDLGEQSVKNIARPVRVYALRPETVAALPASNVPPAWPIPPVRRRAASVNLVLPFTNLGNDPEQQYFADEITEDPTTDLSRIGGSFVIARSTAFTYEGKPIDAKQVGRELGVRYLLEGSVRGLGLSQVYGFAKQSGGARVACERGRQRHVDHPVPAAGYRPSGGALRWGRECPARRVGPCPRRTAGYSEPWLLWMVVA
jgi:hypothetical protein